MAKWGAETAEGIAGCVAAVSCERETKGFQRKVGGFPLAKTGGPKSGPQVLGFVRVDNK